MSISHDEQVTTAAIRAPALMPENTPDPVVSDDRTYLAVPYEEKDEAKALGARWDPGARSWYAPAGLDLTSFSSWIPGQEKVHIEVDADPREQFAEALRDCGLQVDGPAVMDGSLQRVPVEGDWGRQRSGAYFGHLDGRPAGFIQNHRTGAKANWTAVDQAKALGAQDRAQLAAEAAQKRHDRAREREKQAEQAAQQVEAIWTVATPVEAHPYLDRKEVASHGLRQGEDGRLLVPLQDAAGKLWSMQHIGEDGFKMFREGGRVEGGHFVLGNIDAPGSLLIAEGYATAATVHELTDMPTIVAFTAGNLEPVALTYRSIYPERGIYIAADNDHRREAEGKPNVGREKAEQAAQAIGGNVLLPRFSGTDAGSDWNDLAQSQGKQAALTQLAEGMAISERQHLAREIATARDLGQSRGASLEDDRTPGQETER